MDVCCLNRPFDDLSKDRVYLEAESVMTGDYTAERDKLLDDITMEEIVEGVRKIDKGQ